MKESASDEMDRIKAEEEQDLRERDELAARIRQRDKEKTRNIVTKSEKKAEEEAAKRLFFKKLYVGVFETFCFRIEEKVI